MGLSLPEYLLKENIHALALIKQEYGALTA